MCFNKKNPEYDDFYKNKCLYCGEECNNIYCCKQCMIADLND